MNNERKIKDFSELTTRQQRRRVLSHLHLHHRSVHASQLSSTDIVHSTQETTQEPIPSTSKAVTIDEHSEIFDSTLSSSTLSTADASIKSSDISVYHPVSSHKIVSNFESDLRALIIKHHVSHQFVNDLLPLLRDNGHNSLPRDVRTFMKTPVNTSSIVNSCAGGHYIHFGFEKMLHHSLVHYNYTSPVVSINFNIDGLPISKSSNSQLWPIQGAICIKDTYTEPFIVGLFYGAKKPSDANEYLKPFCDEAKGLLMNGIYVNNNHISIKINAIICDAPARAFIAGIKSHTGYFGCSKCTTEGTFTDNRVIFPQLNATLRSDVSFLQKIQEEHHKSDTILHHSLNIGMMQDKSYAVVAFLDEEDSYSEIPSFWLSHNNTKCWWPKSKTPSNFIKRGAKPDPAKWSLCSVRVEGTFSTLEEARKRAENEDYTSSEEVQRNRKKNPKYVDSQLAITSDEEYSTSRSGTPPPQMCEEVLVYTSPSTSPINLEQMPVIIADNIVESDKIYELLVSTNLYVKGISARLEKMENSRKIESVNNHDALKDLRKMLPLSSTDDINQFEIFLGDDEQKKIFTNFISSIGGRNVKDNIHRCLKSIFSNEAATKCSWLGQRGNFRVCDLSSITVLKDQIQVNYNITLKEFEVIGSEWFRLSKLRLKPDKRNPDSSNVVN
ncbi:hypothetical protein PPYR_09961 [Photinus pyralis]|uniref:DUF4806 domain-containing protein n=1 Tax=Photinus pyralis TaxID=7054 RepID=A0A5N4AEZ2_PHOPY|nr:hypothetical protein PPYR_09961 [Photinus pyralis]